MPKTATKKRNADALMSANDDYQNITIQLAGAVADSIIRMYLYTMPRPTSPASVTFQIGQDFGPWQAQPSAVISQNGANWQFTASLDDPIQWRWNMSLLSICGTNVVGELDNVYGWVTPTITPSLAPTPLAAVKTTVSSTQRIPTARAELDSIAARVHARRV